MPVKTLSIAGIVVQLRSDSPFMLEEGYLPFVVNNAFLPSVLIDCHLGIPPSVIPVSTPVFEAKTEVQQFYAVYDRGSEGLLFQIFDQQDGKTQQIAISNATFDQWEIFSESMNGMLIPLKFPLGPIIIHYMALNLEAVLMHASCVFDGQKGRLFSGFSGAGKSTISRIFSKSGQTVVNDDRILIRKEKGNFIAYNTPMYYVDQPKNASLDAIYLIHHSPENSIKQLTGALAVTKVMAFCIQNNFDRQFVNARLNFFVELCSKVKVYELGFVPDKSVVDFISQHAE
ncbi:MAG: hypothetical protein ACP5F6_00240 [Microbacter sp.]